MMSPIAANNEERGSVIDSSNDHAIDSAAAAPHFVLSPANSTATTESSTGQKSQCSSLSDGENFEWTAGENNADEVDKSANGIKDLDTSNNNVGDVKTPTGISRNTWLRTSLRRSTPNNQEHLSNRRWGSFRHNGRRQNLGSNALASQLYRSSSFNSSGRSSTCDTTDDMYSDASLEEDVHDLHHKFQVLQQQVGNLQDSAHQNDERYTRVKSDNAALQARVIMLEEQLRETELRCEEKIQDEQRRSKEHINRLEREKQLQLENASIRLQNAEGQCEKLKEELNRERLKIEKLETQRDELLNQVQDLTYELNSAREESKECKERENRLIRDHTNQTQLLEELSKEVERLRTESRTPALPTTSPETIRLEELHEEMSLLREQNSQLQEANEELQANLLHTGLETGRILATGNIAENSLAHELDIMSQDEVSKALKEQQDVNRQLRTYIDGILLTIVEHHPQLLEVKHKNGVN